MEGSGWQEGWIGKSLAAKRRKYALAFSMFQGLDSTLAADLCNSSCIFCDTLFLATIPGPSPTSFFNEDAGTKTSGT